MTRRDTPPEPDPDERRPRYPEVRLPLRTSNPLVLVAAVRHELRNAGIEAEAIAEFTSSALAGDESSLRQTCAEWIETSRDGTPRERD